MCQEKRKKTRLLHYLSVVANAHFVTITPEIMDTGEIKVNAWIIFVTESVIQLPLEQVTVKNIQLKGIMCDAKVRF